jgi:hypothetical protein
VHGQRNHKSYEVCVRSLGFGRLSEASCSASHRRDVIEAVPTHATRGFPCYVRVIAAGEDEQRAGEQQGGRAAIVLSPQGQARDKEADARCEQKHGKRDSCARQG